jgi:hypothetical protein
MTESPGWKIRNLELHLIALRAQTNDAERQLEEARAEAARPNINSLVNFCKTLAPHERLLIVRDRSDLQPYGEAIEIESFNVHTPGCVELRVRPR